ncbi:MAG: hypothetical protein HYR62_06845 [Actinobacteria bacterium]|nr:hypothetical protein [Actinomycetota bacterium]MBI3688301.1 hypothetical protein [Actinomycetota bacterium]
MPSATMLPGSLISMPEIAELAAVKRPVVTTWRRRHPDFPTPAAGDTARPLFDARKVVDWLVGTGRAERDRIEADLRLHLLACLTGDAASEVVSDPSSAQPSGQVSGRMLSPRQLIGAITALICLRHLDDEPLHAEPEQAGPEHAGPDAGGRCLAGLRDRAAHLDPGDTLLRGEIDAIPDGLGWLPTVVDELIEAGWGCRGAYEQLLATRHRLGVPDLFVDTVTAPLAGLIAGLAGVGEHADRHGAVRLAVPDASGGDLALAALAQVGDEQVGEETLVSVVVASTDRFLARLVVRRLLVHGLPRSGVTVTGGGTSAVGTAAGADVALLHLPYRPGEERGSTNPLDEVWAAAQALAPGQTAVVLGPAELLVGALPAHHPAWPVRRDLLESGRMEAVIHLPGGLVPFRPGYQTAVWVLRHEPQSPWQGRVLLADVAHLPLTAALADTLIWDVITWRRDGHHPQDHLRAHAAQVAVAALLRPQVPLTTRRPVGPRDIAADPRPAVARVAELEAELNQLASTGGDQAPLRSGLATRDDPTGRVSQSVGTLITNGRLIVRKGNRIDPAHLAPDGQHPLLGAPELTGGVPVGSRRIDRAVLATTYPRVEFTEPGDVVVTLTPRLGVHLDRDGFAVVEFPARVLRVPAGATEHLRPRVLTALLSSLGGATGRASGAVRSSHRLEALPIPELPAGEVARLDALLAEIDERRDAVRRQLALLDELDRIATTGLAVGRLTITPDTASTTGHRPAPPRKTR